MGLCTQSVVILPGASGFLDPIKQRVMSFGCRPVAVEAGMDFRFPFGLGSLRTGADDLTMSVEADTLDGLGRIKEILATAVEINTRALKPAIVWTGDHADSEELAQLRTMRVSAVSEVTPLMRRFRLLGENLDRFSSFGGLHIRLLFPTAKVPAPDMPKQGPDGLPLWPADDKRPATRVYTIRAMDVSAGWMDVDFVLHGDDNAGSRWALMAKVGDEIGIMGPIGRPFRKADWYVLGCDETGLPALGRILEELPAEARGLAFCEVASAAEEQALTYDCGVTLTWIHRDGVAPGDCARLRAAIKAVEWPTTGTRFGWFSAESAAAQEVREHWRDVVGAGREETLAAGYWRKGAVGTMGA